MGLRNVCLKRFFHPRSVAPVDMGLRKTFSQCYHENDEQCGYSEMEGSDWTMLYYWNSEQCGCAENEGF